MARGLRDLGQRLKRHQEMAGFLFASSCATVSSTRRVRAIGMMTAADVREASLFNVD
jgi:hypothetical protein